MKQTMDRMSNAFRGNTPAEKRAHFRKQREAFKVQAALGSFQVQARALGERSQNEDSWPPRLGMEVCILQYSGVLCYVIFCTCFYMFFTSGPRDAKLWCKGF